MEDLFGKDLNGAEFSECGKYRYKLWRIWDDTLPKAMCIGLNPSTANEGKNDPTIDNLIIIMQNLGYGGFYMMNLFAFISSEPKDLLTAGDVVGENRSKLKEVAAFCDDIIFCWGNFKEAENMINEVVVKYPNAKCLGFNKNGRPCHPLSLMYKGTVNTPELFDYKQK